MNLRFYEKDSDKEFRLQLERLAKDMSALENSLNKICNPDLIQEIKEKISGISKEMEQLAQEYYINNEDSQFYGYFLAETSNEERSKSHNIIKTNLRRGKRKARQNLPEME